MSNIICPDAWLGDVRDIAALAGRAQTWPELEAAADALFRHAEGFRRAVRSRIVSLPQPTYHGHIDGEGDMPDLDV